MTLISVRRGTAPVGSGVCAGPRHVLTNGVRHQCNGSAEVLGCAKSVEMLPSRAYGTIRYLKLEYKMTSTRYGFSVDLTDALNVETNLLREGEKHGSND